MNVRHLFSGVMLLTVLFGLVACATERQPAATEAAPSSTAVPDPVANMPTATATPVATPTLTAIPTWSPTATATKTPSPTATRWSAEPHPLQIEVMRQQTYPGSEIVFEQMLAPADNYDQHVVSYQSEGYKIYSFMTIPTGVKPETGWPVIVFNHGYVTPSQYSTTGNYVPYMEMLASNGYIVFKSDYRGHGRSDGEETVGGGFGLPEYTADVLNAVTSLQAYPDVDPERIGMWGHSMGGQITLRAMVVSPDIKAGVIWGGVVSPYPDVIARWDFTRNPDFPPDMIENISATPQSSAGNWLQKFSDWVNEFAAKYGEPDENPAFWDTISPNSYLEDLSGPIQLHHSVTDEMVPLAWSETLVAELEAVDNTAYEFYTYPNDNHNIVVNYGTAMQRTVAFFDSYVKENNRMNIRIGDRVLTATLVENSSTEALKGMLAEGPITIQMRDFERMEKVGPLGMNLPRNDEQITAEAGDLILFQGSAFVIYYAPNSWNFTRLGKIDAVTAEELKAILGDGDVTITLSLATGG